eukprot:CAMPEP_0172917742 /NCGR_PEP_ID=MMETSP1075-20121228/198854_1 /TAXON_ID=2916 /ORGANISM="Ceratium fusus, Strain PA161109" /LENGTH=511 /DNA_ID=CAMNT_0013777259 /DNA_START=7 /DNA_END=1542 /DNA_ORIENTATION=+
MSILRMSMAQKVSAQDITRQQGWGKESVSTSNRTSVSTRAQSTANLGVSGSVENFDEEEEDMEEAEKDPKVVFEHRFNMAIGGLIILNVFVIALETDYGYDETGDENSKIWWVIVDSLFLLAFMIEIAVRMCLERWAWPWSAWNWFDVVIVILAMVDIWILSFIDSTKGSLQIMSVFRIVRLVRLIRLVKLIRLLHGLYVILSAMWNAVQTMSFLLAIMVFGLLIYSIFAVTLIGRNSALSEVRINGTDTVYDRFGTVFRSMYSLFELMTLEGWETVARPIVEAEPWLFFFIASYIMIFTFGMLNMIVATVIEKTLLHTRMMSDSQQAEERKRMQKELLSVKKLFTDETSKEKAGRLTYEEFEKALMVHEPLREIFGKMGISIYDAKELYTVLDWDDSGDLTVKEFMSGIQKLQDGICSPWDSLATHAIVRSNRNKISSLHEELVQASEKSIRWRQEAEQRAQVQDKALKDILRRLRILSAASEAKSDALASGRRQGGDKVDTDPSGPSLS